MYKAIKTNMNDYGITELQKILDRVNKFNDKVIAVTYDSAVDTYTVIIDCKNPNCYIRVNW